MKYFFVNVLKDIQQRKNIEYYTILLLGIIILAADIFGITSESIFQGILLATMSVLIYSTIESRRSNDEVISKFNLLKQAINPSACLKRSQPAEITSAFTRAKKISFLNVTNFSWIEQNYSILSTLLKKGGSIRCILVEPDSDAFRMVLDRNPKGATDADGLKMTIHLSEKLLYQIAKETGNESGVEVRFTQSLAPLVMTMIDENLECGEIFASFNGYKQGYNERPSVTLNKIQDAEWFVFYQKTYDEYWESATKSKPA